MANYDVPIGMSVLVVLCTTMHAMGSEGLSSPSLDYKSLQSRSQAQGLGHGRPSINAYSIKLKYRFNLYIVGSNSPFLDYLYECLVRNI